MSASGSLGKQFQPVIRHDPTGLTSRMVVAHHPVSDRPIGQLSWLSADDKTPPKVYKAFVQERYRRKGVGTALWDAARHLEPDLHHSHALSEDGAAFAAKTPVDRPSAPVAIHGPAEPAPRCDWCGGTRAVKMHQGSRMDAPAPLCTTHRKSAG